MQWMNKTDDDNDDTIHNTYTTTADRVKIVVLLL